MKKKILLSGGGTGGTATPLLAIIEELESVGSQDLSYIWLGTKQGIEREMVNKLNINYQTIFSGKFRRYFSFSNLIDPIFIILGFFQSLYIVWKEKPDLTISAGSFVSVPVVWAAWAHRVPILIHQQDVRKGLANKLMSPFTKNITVTFEKSLEDYKGKALWTGNPIRKNITEERPDIKKIKKESKLNEKLPILLVVGGGTGAQAINKIVIQSLRELTKFCQVIHIAGIGKSIGQAPDLYNYQQVEFLDVERMTKALHVADLVVSRCGMNLLTELSYLAKPTILIPIPNSHQEDNAEIFYNAKAAIVLDQTELTPEILSNTVKKVLNNSELKNNLKKNITKVFKKNANSEIIELINKLIN